MFGIFKIVINKSCLCT